MKKIAKLCVAVLSLSAFLTGMAYAATPGTYAGLGLGASKQETPSSFDINVHGVAVQQSHNIGGLGGRIFAGYNFNNYFGLEAGLAQYAQSKNKANIANIVNGSVTYKMTALDLVGKAYLPIQDSGFNVYGLGGVALVHSQSKGNVNAPGIIVRASETQNKIRPIVGLGASYDIPSTQLTTSVEYSHIIGNGNVKSSSSAIPSADLVTLNLAYNFG